MEVFGIIGMTFAIIAWGLVANVKKEVDELKMELVKAGVLAEPPQP